MKRVPNIGLTLAVLSLFLSGWAPAAEFGLKSDRLLIDQDGRDIRLEKPYKRIMSLYGAHTENLFSLGLTEEVIGVAGREGEGTDGAAKPVYSYHDDPEKFLAARPDLVLIRPMIDRGYGNLMDRLEKSGITVVSLQPSGMADMYRYWEILGLLTGKRSAAIDMIRRFQCAVSEFHALSERVASKKTVYFESVHKKMKTFSPSAMAICVLEAAGGVNAAADADPVRETNIAAYGKERILLIGDRIDVYLAQVGVMNRPSLEEIRNEPGFSLIRAVKQNEIHLVDETVVSRPTFRLLKGISDIGTILYPAVFGDEGPKILKRASEGSSTLTAALAGEGSGGKK